MDGASCTESERRRARCGRIVFACVALVWLLLDQLSKAVVVAWSPGEVIRPSELGLVELVSVRNTGGAWGIFSDSTMLLGAFSLIVCAIILLYELFFAKNAPLMSRVGAALVFAGGIGNAIDRFWHGYVVDFISFAFIDFPVFNVADIGVTVGAALFLASMLLSARKDPDGTSHQPHSGS